MTGWWFQTCFIFPFHIWDVILPIDELIFSRWFFNHQPDGNYIPFNIAMELWKPWIIESLFLIYLFQIVVFHSKLSVYQRVISISSSINRRKFRSQTSDNMDIWKAEQARGREKRKIRKEKIREEKDQKREDQRRERVRRNKMQMREKVRKSRNTLFFQWFVAPEGRKVGSLKRRVRSQLARWEMKNCTPLWREAHFQVKMYKTHHSRTTFGSWDVEKVHAVAARSTFPSQKC